jgi:glycosyltransferase involved in cell wall biosynthesis
MMGGGKPMHLVFFSDCPYFGGAEEYIAMLAQACPGPEWRISALVSAGEGGETLAGKLQSAGVRVIRFRVRSCAHPALWSEVGRALRRLRGDVLHLNLPSIYDGRLSVPALLAKAAGYRRVVTTEHLPMIKRARRRMAVKLLLSPAIDAIVVHTDWNRQFLAHHHHMPLGKIVVIPNGSPEAPPITEVERISLRASLGVSPDEVAITVVARLTRRKGHRFLFEALALLDRERPPGAAPGRAGMWKLLVVGEGEEDQALARLATDLGLSDRVVFLGQMPDARQIIHVSDLLLLPSLLESQPLVITEAMASRVPVVASRIYGIPEIVADGHTGLLVEPGAPRPLAEALGRLLGDSELRGRLGAAGRCRYEEQFTQQIMASRTYEVLSGRTRRS